MTDTPDERDAGNTPGEAEATPPKIRRKYPATGMKISRVREIQKLIKDGREHEVPPEELHEAQEGSRQLRESMNQLGERLAPDLSHLQDAARRITARNLNLSQGNASSWLEPEKIELLAHQRPPAIEPPDLDGIAESMAEAQAEKNAQVKRAQDTADETNNLLIELTALMASVETSNRNTERVTVEIKAHREQAAAQQAKQDRINVLLAVTAVLVAAASLVVSIVTGAS
ncbi:hypothetical protein [Kocuria rhizophila]|uniref:hypothetical protein n=1 Tax=Kocuria rhizophila TaxID=72000 RepID=UPI0011AE1E7A|nr:hypothetical protein [Kocuria rhizophila]